jgi:hypothetical protein
MCHPVVRDRIDQHIIVLDLSSRRNANSFGSAGPGSDIHENNYARKDNNDIFQIIQIPLF